MASRRSRTTAAAVTTVAVLCSVTACATGGTPSSGGTASALKTSASPAALKGTITVWSWDTAAAALKRVGKQFEKDHPGTTVKVVDVGYDNVYDKISVGFQSGSGLPDVITVESDHMATYFTKFPKGMVNLAPAADPMKSDFAPSKWAASSNGKGELFSLPWDSGPVGVFYRRDLFQRAGVDPSSIKTWQDYIAAGEKIKAKTGKAMLIDDVSGDDSMLQIMLQQLGQGWFTKDGKIDVDSPNAHKALKVINTMQKKGLIANEKGWDGLVSATKAGKAAAQPTAVWWDGTLTSEMPELKGKYGVMPLPTFKGQGADTSNNGGSSLAIPSQSKHQQLAWAFIKFALADTANEVSMMKKDGLFPSYLPALKDPYFKQPQPYYDGQKAYEVFAGLVNKIPPITYTGDQSKASDVMINTVAGVLLNGKSVDSSLSSAAKQLADATGRKVASSK